RGRRSVAGASGRQRPWWRGALLATSALAFVALAAPAHAQTTDATWLPNPASGDFNAGSNWSSGVVPNGTATFNASSQRDVSFSGQTILGGISLTAGAGAIRSTTRLLATSLRSRARVSMQPMAQASYSTTVLAPS